MSAPAPEGTPGHAPAPAADVMAHTIALLQPWIDFVPRQQRRLGLFIFLALLVHIAAFFFIRIDANRAEIQHQVRTHATVENLQAAPDASSADAFWDRLNDPRLFLLPILPLTEISPDEPPIDFSAINTDIGPQDLPPAAPTAGYQLLHSPGAMLQEQAQAELHPERQPFFYNESAPSPPAKTTWQLGPLLAARQPLDLPQLPSPVSDTDLAPTELRVAIDPAGAVQYVLLEETCQEPDLDRQAILAARKISFQPTDQPGLTWGKITIFWHYTTPPPEVVAPTPPST